MKILVRNLSRKTTEAELMALFTPFGTVSSLNIVMDEATKTSKGFGFVEMSDMKQAKSAIQGLNGKKVDGEKIRVKTTKK